MQNRIVLDTSFVTSLVSENDINNRNAQEQWEEMLKDNPRIFLPVTAYFELQLGEFYCRLPKNFSINKFINEAKIDIHYFGNSSIINSLELLKMLRNNLKTIDFSVVLTGLQLDAEIMTFDNQMIKAIKGL